MGEGPPPPRRSPPYPRPRYGSNPGEGDLLGALEEFMRARLAEAQSGVSIGAVLDSINALREEVEGFRRDINGLVERVSSLEGVQAERRSNDMRNAMSTGRHEIIPIEVGKASHTPSDRPKKGGIKWSWLSDPSKALFAAVIGGLLTALTQRGCVPATPPVAPSVHVDSH